MHELPLIIFTLLLQSSVGVTIGLALIQRRAVAGGDARQAMLWPLVCTFVLAAIGLTASTLHLGYPLNAFNALRHVASSWLSREIVFASLYLAAMGLALVLIFFRKPGWPLLLWLAALLGAVDVYCMAQIYIHTSVVSWQHINTLVMFIGTAGSAGAVVLAGLRALGMGAANAVSLRWVLAVIVGVVLIRLLMQPVWLNDIANAASQGVTFPHSPLSQLQLLRGWHITGWCAGVVGMLCFAGGVRRHSGFWMALGGVLLLVSEVVLRFVFFSIG